MNLTGKKILMIVAPDNFRDEELLEPKEIFEGYGAEVMIASKDTNSAEGMLGAFVTVDIDISEIKIEDYDAIIFVGGSGSSVYFDDEMILDLAKKAYEKNKIIGAICIAPSILANSGILKNKKATCFSSEKENLEERGAEYTGRGVEKDDNIITANGPNSASAFGQKISETLNQE